MYIRWRVMGFSYARGASSFNATSFSRSRTPALIVGRSPWIAAHALVGLSWLSKGLILRAKSGSRGTRADQGADQGVCPTGKLSGIGVKLRFPGVQCGGRGGRAEACATRLVNFLGFFQRVAGGREAGGGLRKIHARTAADAAGHGLHLAGEPGVHENHLEQRAFLVAGVGPSGGSRSRCTKTAASGGGRCGASCRSRARRGGAGRVRAETPEARFARRAGPGGPAVAVGTAVAHCPPHRPVLALLTHTVPASDTDVWRQSVRWPASRTRSSPCDPQIRHRVRYGLGSGVFSLACGLPSTTSAGDLSLLFGCFASTTPQYDSPLPCMRDL